MSAHDVETFIGLGLIVGAVLLFVFGLAFAVWGEDE